MHTTGRANADEATPGPNDALIIAGDISHDLDVIHDTLSTITTNLQCHTFFVPGNHEAWISGSKMDDMGLTDSFTKLEKVVEVCDKLGVHTSAKLVGGSYANTDDDEKTNHRHPVWIVPMWSWYDGSLALPNCEDLSAGLESWPWVDFRRCEWGDEYDGKRKQETVDPRFTVPGCERVPSQELTKLFLSWNEDSLQEVKESSSHRSRHCQIGRCLHQIHFVARNGWTIPFPMSVPSLPTLPVRSSSMSRFDRSCLGHVRKEPATTNKQIHIFGHSHRPKDFVLNGIRYIHNPVGKPVEREMNMINDKFDFQLIWDCTESGGGEVKAENTITRYWDQYGGGVELLAENMAKRRRRRRVNKQV